MYKQLTARIWAPDPAMSGLPIPVDDRPTGRLRRSTRLSLSRDSVLRRLKDHLGIIELPPLVPRRYEGANPTVAVMGRPDASDIGIFGAGVLVASTGILTAKHVVGAGIVPACRYRVFSPLVGYLKVKKIHLVGDSELAVIELERPVPDGLPPAELGDRPSRGELLHAGGFGGGDTGLFQVIEAPVMGRLRGSDAFVKIAKACHLGRRDSGAPFLAGIGDEGLIGSVPLDVKAVYIGTRTEPGSERGRSKFLRLGAVVAVEKGEIETILDSLGGMERAELTQLEVTSQQSERAFPDSNEHRVGACEQNRHDVTVENRKSSRLVISVNGTTHPLRTRLGLRIRVEGPHAFDQPVCEPGPFQSLAIPSWGNDPTDHRGDWTITVEAETEVTYQIWAALYVYV